MEIKKYYLPLAIKKKIIEAIVSESLYEKDGMKFIDYISYQLSYDLSLLQFYCEIDIANIDMDELYENHKIHEIRTKIPESEIKFIEENALHILKQEVEIYNSIGGVLSRSLFRLIDKIPDEKAMNKILNKIPKTIEKINPETLEILKSVMDEKLDSPQPQLNREQRRKMKVSDNIG